MDALQAAQRCVERAESYYDTAEEKDGNAFYRGRGDAAMARAAIFAAVAQAEQLKRIADATERRNELLSEFNQANAQSTVRHTEAMNVGVKKILDAFYGPDDVAPDNDA